MARTSDISHRVPENAHRQYLRLSTVQAANDCISNAIAKLPIFDHFSFDLEMLYGGVDGQKSAMERPNTQARHSRKYFGRGKGVVAYTLLCNHVPLQGRTWIQPRQSGVHAPFFLGVPRDCDFRDAVSDFWWRTGCPNFRDSVWEIDTCQVNASLHSAVV